MVIVLKADSDNKQVQNLYNWLESMNLNLQISQGNKYIIVCVIGDVSKIDTELIKNLEIVLSVEKIEKPYRMTSRKNHPNDTVIKLDNCMIGGYNFCKIAGPCAVESLEQICTIAKSVKNSGADILRGGAFKPRTSPYSFQGLGKRGLEFLIEAKKVAQIPIVSEITNIDYIDMFSDVDIIQVGARNMQNFELLKQLGKCNKPIILKRGFCSTIEELLMSAEYIMSSGNLNVILCERGIRTFEKTTRNTLDIVSIPAIKEISHLPIIVDTSHSTGSYKYVKPMTLAATSAGANGFMIEVHDNPKHAMSDGGQSLNLESFKELSKQVDKMLELLKTLQ